MDYRLKSLYEQILRGEPVKQTPKEQPKSLAEAYKVILTERTAFYAKEVPSDQETQPEIAGLDSLGTVPQADRIKFLIASQTAKPEVNKLMLAAGNWTNVDNYEEDLLGPISTELFAAGFGMNEIAELIKSKATLSNFSKMVATEKFFNTMSDSVVPNLNTLLPKIKTNKLNDLYKYCFTKKCKINDIAVGFGEIALSLFTDCKKGKVGDLDSPTAGAIEVKTNGGRIAKKTQVNTNYKESLIEFLKNQNAEQKVSKSISTLKHNVEEQIDRIKENNNFVGVFTNKYEKYITDLIASIGTNNFSKLYANSPFKDVVQGKASTIYQKALQNGLVVSPTEHSSPVPESLKQYVLDTHRLLSQIFRDKKLQGQYESILSTSQAAIDVSKLSVWDSIQYFFFTDFGFTTKQLAEGLLLLVNPKARATAEEFLPEIEEFFTSPYAKSLKAGNMKVLKGLIFALQVSIYAKGLFNYLFVVNTATFEGIGFKTGSLMHLFKQFYQNSERFSLDIDLDPDRGGSAISVKSA